MSQLVTEKPHQQMHCEVDVLKKFRSIARQFVHDKILFPFQTFYSLKNTSLW